jgi:lysozyme
VLSEKQFANFFLYYKDLPNQRKAVALLREAILDVDADILSDAAEWVKQYRKKDEPVPGKTGEREIGEAGLKLIKSFEGLMLHAYKCSAGVLTIGYGHTGGDVYPDQVITDTTAEELLQKDLRRFEKGVGDYVNVPLTQNEFDALVSFAFNCGLGALAESTLLRRLNAGEDKPTVFRQELVKWVNGPNGPLPGLVRRRDAEIALATTA